ncbi:Putative beta-barrel porin-2, OmpL-like. bbp2 [Arachidicoccus rhizosphaerae]|uniref:Putative beta-barrel porin-2, OmpL-like. bbp2 n=1 Tax=Arachidicoccus rhizosphaerae TaxID=551991 RepID=A0A1H4CV36_9BACT|nr:outer membrane beta-barrel protein [Arachidicoccus rhizosphaerae]SEA64159.1 Putative beta-barrel porin-2, OmpL-like. bbp2 [Arachidicoccus rhizosphaerae]
MKYATILLFLLPASLQVMGQSADTTSASPPTFKISGSVDGYYRYNFANAKKLQEPNNLTSFTNTQNSFELGMASLRLDASMGKVGAVVDLGYGKRADEFSYNDEGSSLRAVKQAFITYAASEKVTFSFGKWATHIGYEVLDAYLNRNYSMDYMFSYGPFSHTGLKVDIALGNFGIMAGLVNPTDYVSASFADKNFIGQLSGATSNGKLHGYLNYVGGKDLDKNTVNQGDLVVTATVTPKFSIGYNGSIKSVKMPDQDVNSWWGSALYFNVDPTPAVGFTLRGEYFDDKKNVAGIGTCIFDATLSANIHVSSLTIIPEFRLDQGKDAVFYKSSDESGMPTSKGTGTFVLGLAYNF